LAKKGLRAYSKTGRSVFFNNIKIKAAFFNGIAHGCPRAGLKPRIDQKRFSSNDGELVKKIFYGWWIVLACFCISLYVGGTIFYGFTAFIKPLREEFGWSYTEISFATSLRGMEIGIFSPLVGFLVDRFGPRKLILFGTITLGLGLVLLSFTQSLAMFYASILIVGLGSSGCATVVSITAVANWFRRRVGIALGVMISGFGASGLMVPLVVQFIDVYGWRTTFVILGTGMWILGIPLSLVIRNKPEQYGYRTDGELTDEPEAQHELERNDIDVSFQEAVKHRSFLYLCFVETIRMMVLFGVVTHVMPYLGSIGIARTTAGFITAAIPLLSILGRFGFGWLSDFFEKRNIMTIVFCLMSLGLLAFCFAQIKWFLFLFLLLFPPGLGGSMVIRGPLIREYFGRRSFGKLLGITMGIASIGGIAGPTAAGWVFDTFDSYKLIWFTFSGLIITSVFLIFRIRSLVHTISPSCRS